MWNFLIVCTIIRNSDRLERVACITFHTASNFLDNLCDSLKRKLEQALVGEQNDVRICGLFLLIPVVENGINGCKVLGGMRKI